MQAATITCDPDDVDLGDCNQTPGQVIALPFCDKSNGGKLLFSESEEDPNMKGETFHRT